MDSCLESMEDDPAALSPSTATGTGWSAPHDTGYCHAARQA
jgi:hypothetical protein